MLLVCKNTIRKTYYEVLSVKEDASYEEIRTNYKTAALNSHPDKLPVKQNGSQPEGESQNTFLHVQKAWEVLCDPSLRAKYDEELRELRQELVRVLDEVHMHEMVCRTIGAAQEFLCECRCGDYYSITSEELEEIGVIPSSGPSPHADMPASVILLACDSCSLRIRLIIDKSTHS